MKKQFHNKSICLLDPNIKQARSPGQHVDPRSQNLGCWENLCVAIYAIPSTRDVHIHLRRPQLYRVPSNTPHVLQEPQACHAHIPISPCSNPKIRVASFLILAKPSLSGAKPSLSVARLNPSEARPTAARSFLPYTVCLGLFFWPLTHTLAPKSSFLSHDIACT